MTAAATTADAGRLLGVYRSIESASRDMLAAAIDEDWDRVAGLQRHCDSMIDQARRLATPGALSGAEHRAKMRIMRQIVHTEAQIRRLAHPWTERHERLLFPRTARPQLGERAR